MKNNFKFKVICLVAFIIPACFSFVLAQSSETPFGGLQTISFELACTCRGNSHWVFDYKDMKLIKLYRAPQSKFYDYNNYLTGMYQLGSHTQTATDGCWVYDGSSCELLFQNDYDYGTMPGTGTSQ